MLVKKLASCGARTRGPKIKSITDQIMVFGEHRTIAYALPTVLVEITGEDEH